MKKALWLVVVYAALQMLLGLGFSHRPELALLFSILMMTAYLGTFGFLSGDKQLYSPLSAPFVGWSLLFGISTIFVVDGIMRILPPLPNYLEETFDVIQSDWLGILCLVLLGPILEELLFRGAITKSLLESYPPPTAILLSGVLFGAIHLNPPQVVPGMLIGFAFAWLYYLTRSIVPGVLIHIFNNGLSVILSFNFPKEEDLPDITGHTAYVVIVATAALMLVLSIGRLRALANHPSETETTDHPDETKNHPNETPHHPNQ
jgi:membrane protease YdiL (CAAX protease family)